jgi:NhaC family Na+:H+ antiporter
MQFSGDNAGDIPTLLGIMSANFNINPVLLIPPIFIIAIIALKVPPLPGILAGAVIAVPLFFIFQANMQHDSFAAAAAGIVDNLHYGFSIDTGNDTVDSLFNRGGMHRKMWAVSLIMVAMVFGGVMEKTGCLKSITEALVKFAKGIGSLTVVSLISAIVGNLITADQYLSLILPGRMYRVEYIKRGYHTKNLGRTLEAGGTLTSSLIPWNSCGATMIVTLGLTAWTYVPFAFFNLACIVLTLVYAFVGFSVAKLTPEEQAEMLASAEKEM